MNTTPQDRIAAYLDDLGRMLEPADPALRTDVLGGVREHIDAALDDKPATLDEVDEILGDLGPPEDVAAAALADDRPAPPALQAPSGLDRAWVPPVVGLLLLVVAGLYSLVIGAMAAFMVAETTTAMPADTGDFHAPRVEDFGAPLLPASYDLLWSTLAPLPLVALPWLASTVLLAGSSLWTTRQKWLGALLLPLLVLVCGLLIATTVLVPVGTPRAALVLGVFVAVAVGTVWAVVHIWRSGAQAVRQPASVKTPTGQRTAR